MPVVKGRDAVRNYLTSLPEMLSSRVLPGAARAGANVIADEARRRSISKDVTAAIKVATKRGDGRVFGKVQVKGEGSYLAPWLEYGTSPHFISVDPVHAGGRTAGRINRLDAAAQQDGRAGPGESLKINGKFVGATVFHPGAVAHPFLRVSLDVKEEEAVQAAQAYITARLKRLLVPGAGTPEGDDQ